MSRHKGHIQSVIAGFVITGVCLLSSSTAAQQPKEATLSDDDLINLHQQIKELKNPTFRAFLRMQLLSWESPEAGPTRRRAAMEVATQGVTDLCEHQDAVWAPTASWLHESLVKQIKTLQTPEDTALEICVLKTGTTNKSAKDLSSGIKMLSNHETSAARTQFGEVGNPNGTSIGSRNPGPTTLSQRGALAASS